MAARSIETEIHKPVRAFPNRAGPLLPPAIPGFAKCWRLAARIHARARQSLRAAVQRLVRRAPGPAPTAGAAIGNPGGGTSSTRGCVTLVGAGPGDPELLTLRAVRVLQAADAVLYDDLVSDAVLALSRRAATRMPVGKRSGRASCSQDAINALMVTLARQGKHVVRLKSGDPTIFGRAGEEIATLRAAGIPVSVVPGITAASAMASALSASLTHRDHAHSVRFVTGHLRHGTLPDDLDWDGMADRETTLVFYMGARTAPMIAKRLIKRGLPPATPAVIVSSVTLPEEHRWQGLLRLLGDGIGEFDIAAPIILGIGAVFAADRECISPLSAALASAAPGRTR